MIAIKDEVELFSVVGNVKGGKVLLLNSLFNKNLSEEEIKNVLVEEYGIMKNKSFIHTLKEYQRIKRFLEF